jgi:hypothetical protein
LDADQSIVPTKRGRGKLVDLVAAKSRHRGKKKDLELFGLCRSQFLARAFEQCRHVEA